MHPSTLVMLLLLCLVVTCHAYSTFKTNCSIPSSSFNYVSSPNTRGTTDIIKGCLFTLFTCTWTIQHLNVPEQRAKGGGYCSKTCGILKGIWTSLKWMLFTIVAPEFIVGKALADLVAARLVMKGMKSLAEYDGVEWELSHGFYVNMGGFVGVEKNSAKSVRGTPLSAQQIYLLRTTMVGTSERDAGRAEVETYINKLPDLTAADIDEKSHSDTFEKIISSFQVAWVIAQGIERASTALPVSLLEITVAAFSALTIFTYLLLLYKPKGVKSPTRIACNLSEFEKLTKFNPNSAWVRWRETVIPPCCLGATKWLDKQIRTKIPNDFSPANFDFETGEIPEQSWSDTFILAGGAVLGSAIFGGIHVAGWYSTFPTPTEQTLWRVASVLVTVLPVVLLVVWCLIFLPIRCLSLHTFSNLFYIANFSVFIIYIIARLFMWVEISRQLFFLPPEAYKDAIVKRYFFHV